MQNPMLLDVICAAWFDPDGRVRHAANFLEYFGPALSKHLLALVIAMVFFF